MRQLAFAASALMACASAAPSPVKVDGGSCVTAETRACSCGAARMGTQTCIAPEGVWSACGCLSADGAQVAVTPALPSPTRCGAVECPAYPEEDSEVGAKGCCTADGQCGSKSSFLFGAACIARGGPLGLDAGVCPDESGNFIDLAGCCLPDGQCGLSVDAVPNFDLGCIERTRMERLVNEGAGDCNALSLVFFLPIRAASFPPLRCGPR